MMMIDNKLARPYIERLRNDPRTRALFDGSRPFHASPLEHVAQADFRNMLYDADEHDLCWDNRPLHRNFVGFNHYRAIIGA